MRTPSSSVVPLLAGREMIDGRPTAYLCRDFACHLPVTDPAALREQLRTEQPTVTDRQLPRSANPEDVTDAAARRAASERDSQ